MPLRGEFNHEYTLSSVDYESVSLPSYYDKNSLPDNVNLKVDFGKARGEHFVRIYYYPLVLINGEVKLVKKLEIETSSVQKSSNNCRASTFAENSVWATGSLFNIGVR